jgi:hypothetical protein
MEETPNTINVFKTYNKWYIPISRIVDEKEDYTNTFFIQECLKRKDLMNFVRSDEVCYYDNNGMCKIFNDISYERMEYLMKETKPDRVLVIIKNDEGYLNFYLSYEEIPKECKLIEINRNIIDTCYKISKLESLSDEFLNTIDKLEHDEKKNNCYKKFFHYKADIQYERWIAKDIFKILKRS